MRGLATECCVWGRCGEGCPRGQGMSAERPSARTGNQWVLQRVGQGPVTQSGIMKGRGHWRPCLQRARVMGEYKGQRDGCMWQGAFKCYWVPLADSPGRSSQRPLALLLPHVFAPGYPSAEVRLKNLHLPKT